MYQVIAGALSAALLAGLLGLAYTTGRKHEAAAWRAQIAEMRQDAAQAEAEATKAKAAHEAADRAAIAQMRTIHEQELADAQAARTKLAADLRAGNVRLRESFTCPAAADLSDTAAGAGRDHAAAELRAADARAAVAAAIELADQCAAQLRAAQRVIQIDRESIQ
jgi:hypothetical protein